MIFYILMSFLSVMAIPLALVFLFVYAVRRAKSKYGKAGKEVPWQYQIFWSFDDFSRQAFFLLSSFLLAIGLFAVNREMGIPIKEMTVFLFASLGAVVIGVFTRSFYTTILGVITTVIWWFLKASGWMGDYNIQPVILLAGAGLISMTFVAVGRSLMMWENFQRIALFFRVIGSVQAVVILFGLSTQTGLQIFQEMTRGDSLFASLPLTISLFLFTAVTLLLVVYGITAGRLALQEGLVIAVTASLFGVLVFVPEQILFSPGANHFGTITALTASGLVWTLIFNLLFIVLCSGIIFAGYIRQEKWVVNLGVTVLGIFAIVKYFDFFDFRDKSLFFISTGILFLVIGFVLERSRRALISRMTPAQS